MMKTASILRRLRLLVPRLLSDRRGSGDLNTYLLLTAAGCTMVGLTAPHMFKSSKTASDTFDKQVQILQRGAGGGAGGGRGGAGGWDLGGLGGLGPLAGSMGGGGGQLTAGGGQLAAGVGQLAAGVGQLAAGVGQPTAGGGKGKGSGNAADNEKNGDAARNDPSTTAKK